MATAVVESRPTTLSEALDVIARLEEKVSQLEDALRQSDHQLVEKNSAILELQQRLGMRMSLAAPLHVSRGGGALISMPAALEEGEDEEHSDSSSSVESDDDDDAGDGDDNNDDGAVGRATAASMSASHGSVTVTQPLKASQTKRKVSLTIVSSTETAVSPPEDEAASITDSGVLRATLAIDNLVARKLPAALAQATKAHDTLLNVRMVEPIELWNHLAAERFMVFDARCEAEFAQGSVLGPCYRLPESDGDFASMLAKHGRKHYFTHDVILLDANADALTSTSIQRIVDHHKPFICWTLYVVKGGFAAWKRCYPYFSCAKQQRVNAGDAYEWEDVLDAKEHPLGTKVYGCLPNRVLPRLYLSNYQTAHNEHIIRMLNISHVVNASNVHENLFEKWDHMRYHAVHLWDDPAEDIAVFFDDTSAFIAGGRDADENVLVHCVQGVSRSATLLIAYLMQRCDYTLGDALFCSKVARPHVDPNMGFLQQLHSLEQRLHPNDKPSVQLDLTSHTVKCITLTRRSEDMAESVKRVFPKSTKIILAPQVKR